MSKLPRKQTQVAFRLPDDLVARVDRHVERMSEQMPGVRLTRADAIRALLTGALDAVEHTGRGRRR